MKKITRTILFLFFLIVFLLFGPIIVLYSQGYRLDLNPPEGGKRLIQTGGLFLKIIPRQAEVYINDKFSRRTDLFFGSALIDNLLPRKYKITIRKEGYHSWEKELEIREKEVIEAKNIILFTENPVFDILSRNIENFWLSPNEKRIAIQEKNNPEENLWSLKIYDLEKNIKSHLLSEEDISQTNSVDLLELEWSNTSNEIYIKTALNENEEKNFLLNLERIPPFPVERKITLPPENTIASQNSYYLDKSGYVFNNEEKLNENPFPIEEKNEYDLKIFQDFIFLKENQSLYLFNRETKSFDFFFEKINDLKISPDNNKLVYFSDSEIWLFFLKNNTSFPQSKAGESIFLLRFSEKIEDIFWLNSDYLIFNSRNNLKIAEIDDRDKINIINFAEFKDLKIFWNQTDKKLYLSTQGELLVSEKLL